MVETPGFRPEQRSPRMNERNTAPSFSREDGRDDDDLEVPTWLRREPLNTKLQKTQESPVSFFCALFAGRSLIAGGGGKQNLPRLPKLLPIFSKTRNHQPHSTARIGL